MSSNRSLLRSRSPLRRFLMAATLMVAGACSDSPTETNPLAGAYTATVFQVTPEGETAPLNVLGAGGTLRITIDQGNGTTGELRVPGAFFGSPTDFVQSMNGSATLTGSTVRFNQSADTFVRDLTWTLSGRTITTNGTLDGDRFNVVLTR